MSNLNDCIFLLNFKHLLRESNIFSLDPTSIVGLKFKTTVKYKQNFMSRTMPQLKMNSEYSEGRRW